MKKKFLCLTLALVLCLCLVACTPKGPEGTYTDSANTIEFTFENGTVSASAYGNDVFTGTYTVKGDQVYIEFAGEYAEYLRTMDALTYDAKTDSLTDTAGAVINHK